MAMGGTELLIILAIIVLFFGAKRIPGLGRSLGKSIQEFRAGAAEEGEEVRKLSSKGKEEVSSDGSEVAPSQQTKAARANEQNL
jgi:sec-independent protein translocase protein TatA